MKYQIGEYILDVQIIRKNNKNTYIRLKDSNTIYVTTGFFTTKSYIKSLLDNNQKFLIKAIKKYNNNLEKNNQFYFLGISYNVVFSSNFKKVEIDYDNRNIFASNDRMLNKWLSKYICELYLNRLNYIYNMFEEKIPYPKLRIRNIVLGVTKFIVISILIFLLLKFSSSPPSVIFYYSESPIVMTLVLTLSLVLSVISCTSGLMKNLYFSEDNKVLITFPVNANKIFLSKLVVYFVYEVKRAFSFLIPISFSCVLYMFTKRCVSFYALLYMWIPLLFVIALPVLLGALLSIPAMYIYRLLQKLPVLEALIAIFTLIALIILVVKAIDLIPENIDLMNQWPAIAKHIRKFLLLIDENLKICGGLISTIIGEKQPSLSYSLELVSILKLLIVIATDFVLLVLTYYVSRPLFFKMMAKNFEINKKATQKKRLLRSALVVMNCQ